jgi:hypothetical protein
VQIAIDHRNSTLVNAQSGVQFGGGGNTLPLVARQPRQTILLDDSESRVVAIVNFRGGLVDDWLKSFSNDVFDGFGYVTNRPLLLLANRNFLETSV